MFHLVSLSLQISLADLPGPCLGLCVGFACFGWFCCWFLSSGKFDSISRKFQLLTDHVSHLSGNAGKKKKKKAMTDGQRTRESVELPSYQPVGASVMSVRPSV